MLNDYTCYDQLGRPTSTNQVTGDQTHGMSYGYDLSGLMTSFTLPSGRQQSISYDTAGRVSGVSATYDASSTSYASAFSYFPNGALKNVSLGPNSLYQQYCQDTSGRLQIVGIRLAAAGGSHTNACGNSGDALNLAFSYGSAGANTGNLMSETLLPLNATQAFTYDAYDRLATAKEGNTTWSQTYKYDVNGNANASLGNRYSSASSGLGILPSSFTPTQNSNFNSNNLLIIQGSTYDNAGNLKTIGNGGYNFTYDAENRQVSNTANGGNTYYYDGEGRRVEKITGSATTIYVYDAKGEVAAEYSTVPPGPAATLYLTADHLGSTRLTSNAAGAAVGYHDYLPFGEEIPSTVGGRGSLYGAPELTHKFTGKERDTETASSATQGLDFFGARYFSAAQGRFTSPDEPLVDQHAADPQSWNLYAYARNSPLTNTDPNGRWCIFGKIGNTCGDKDIPQPPQPPPVPQGAPGTPTYPLTQARDSTRRDPTVQPVGPPGPTFCNIATCKIAQATGAPLDPLTDKNGTPNLANTDNRTLPNSSKYHEVTPEEAQSLANQGITVIAVQGSAGPHGHIATVRPDNTYFSPYEVRPGGEGPVINNIGRHVEVDRASQAFAKDRPVRYYAPNK